jgi:hypothetical protein
VWQLSRTLCIVPAIADEMTSAGPEGTHGDHAHATELLIVMLSTPRRLLSAAQGKTRQHGIWYASRSGLETGQFNDAMQ